MENDIPKRAVPEALVEAARAHGKIRSNEITQRWKNAKKSIEEEIAQNDGIYPHNKGKLDVKEVCRRADISQQTLYSKIGPHRTTTLVEITKWCDDLAFKKIPLIKKAATERIEYWKSELKKVATQICKYELDLGEKDRTIAEKDRMLREQVEENQKLREQLSRGEKSNVRAFPPTSSKKR